MPSIAIKVNDIYYMEECLIDAELLDDCIAVGDDEGVIHYIKICNGIS